MSDKIHIFESEKEYFCKVLFLSFWSFCMKSASYEYNYKFASNGAQLVAIIPQINKYDDDQKAFSWFYLQCDYYGY